MIRSVVAVLLVAAPLAGQPRTDPHGDPLPDGALVRFGTIRYRIGTVGPYALYPDGRTLAVENGRQVTLWDVDTGRPVRRIPIRGHRTDRITAGPLAYSPDGEHLVRILHHDLRVFNARTGQQRMTLELPGDGYAVAFFPGGTRFAVFGAGKKVWVYDARSGLRASAFDMDVFATALSPTGRFLLGAGPTASLVDAVTGRVIRSLPTQHLFDPAYAFSPDDGRLYAFVPRGFLFAFDTRTGELVEEVSPPPGRLLTPRPVGLALSPDGSVAYLTQEHQPTFRRDLKAGKWLNPLPVMPEGRLVPHPDRKRVLLVGADGLLRRYDLTTLRELPPPDGFAGILTAVPSPDGRRVAVVSGDRDHRLELFDEAGKRLWADPFVMWRPNLYWTADGRRPVTVEWRRIAVRDPATGQPERELAPPPGAEGFSGVAALPPDGRLVTPLGYDGQVAIFDLMAGGPPKVVKTGGRLKPSVSPDGRTVAFGRAGGGPTLVDLATGKTTTGPDDDLPDRDKWAVSEMSFSPDGSYLLTWGRNAVALLRDPTTGQAKQRILIGDEVIPAVAFSPDGLWLATGSPDGMVALWDTATGRQVWARDGHRDAVTRVAFAGPGRLVSSSQDRTALLWDLRADGKPNKPLWDALAGDDAREGYEAVWALAADPNGPRLLRDKIAPAKRAPAEQVRRWLADLGADRYAVREAASRGLRDLARVVEPDMRAERAAVRGEEARTRLDALLGRLTPERTRAEVVHARAVAALERAGTDAAKKVLAEWSDGAPAARLTRDAKAALERMAMGR